MISVLEPGVYTIELDAVTRTPGQVLSLSLLLLNPFAVSYGGVLSVHHRRSGIVQQNWVSVHAATGSPTSLALGGHTLSRVARR